MAWSLLPPGGMVGSGGGARCRSCTSTLAEWSAVCGRSVDEMWPCVDWFNGLVNHAFACDRGPSTASSLSRRENPAERSSGVGMMKISLCEKSARAGNGCVARALRRRRRGVEIAAAVRCGLRRRRRRARYLPVFYCGRALPRVDEHAAARSAPRWASWRRRWQTCGIWRSSSTRFEERMSVWSWSLPAWLRPRGTPPPSPPSCPRGPTRIIAKRIERMST